MNKKEIEETNKAYFGNTMEEAKIELGKYLTRVWKAIDYINKYREQNCKNEKDFETLEQLNTIEMILESKE